MLHRPLSQQLSGLAIGAVMAIGTAHAGPIPVKSVNPEPDGLNLRMEPGVMKLQVCEPRIVRVVYSPSGALPETKSFVVTKHWTPVPFKWQEDANSVTISTGQLQVRVNRATGAIRFLDAAGRALLTEVASGGKTLTPAKVGPDQTHTVEQVFECPPDEALFGLGQFQDGLWNWRGIPLELRQHNTHIAVPMLVSSKGYGLLWDNASLLDFNPADQQIALERGTEPSPTAKMPNATEDLAKTPMDHSNVGYRSGTFQTLEAGDYVFLAKDGDRRTEFAIIVDGRQVAGITNMWTPRSLSAKVTLPAHSIIHVGLRGGGNDAKLYARPLGHTTTFRSQMGDAIDYTFFYGPSPDTILAGYRRATGEAPLWPRWAYGFWQCRERYSSQQQILDTVAEFRKRQIPVDLIIQDWQYWGPHGWGSYEWDAAHYPDPAAMLKRIHELNAKFMISVWCNPHGKAGDEFKQNNLLIGPWIDVFSQQGRDLRWKHLNEAFYQHGTDGWWADATEPGDDGESLAGKQTSAGPGSRLRNSYPLFASQSLYEGQLSSNPDRRVCILTRSAYPGMQRYAAAAWSGDINGDWITFKRQIPAGLNFCLTGIPYWTTDCGGFFRPKDQYKSADYNQLLARWFQWSTFCPILRIHGFQTETEMWKWLPETQKVLQAYDELRYRLLPYTYSVAWKVSNDGYTMMRPLLMDFPNDPGAIAISEQYMFGPAFLVAPVTEPSKGTLDTRNVYLPKGADWVNFWTGEKIAGGRAVQTPAPLHIIPTFVRAGSIVPMGPVVQYADQKPDSPIELRVYPGADGAFTLYNDAGDTYAYEKGERSTIEIRWKDREQELTIEAPRGRYPGMPEERRLKIVLVRPGTGNGMGEIEKADLETVLGAKSLSFKLAKGYQ